MTAQNEVTEYLTTKLERINMNNPKANAGAVYLKKHYEVEQLVHMTTKAIEIIQLHFTRTNTGMPAGEAKLTAVSSAVGNRFYVPNEDDGIFSKWEASIKLGDLFIEALYNTGYIDLYYPKIRNGYHIVSASNKWPEIEAILNQLEEKKELIRATTLTKPVDISSMDQIHSFEERLLEPFPVIKGREEEDTVDVDSVWVGSINKLQQTAWEVDTRIVKSMKKHESDFISYIPLEDKRDKKKELKRRSKIGEWLFITTKAERLSNMAFYQLVQTDYRGRVYYIEPFLNFQGSDTARGMLKFSRSKPMDDTGLYWLAVHTACSYNHSYGIDEIPDWCEADYKTYLTSEGLDSISLDKMTLDDRVRWVNENMDWIKRAGAAIDFYHEAEKTISFAACCLEWYDYHCAVDADEVYRTKLPIPVDGSNNGWQHLGAISKDPHTGELVGLIPTEIQKDFYVQTAKELYNLTTDEELKAILDGMPMKHIRKGISKRGSMTRAYSAGAAKIGENMWWDCKGEDYDVKYGVTEEACMKFAKILIKAINNVCPGPLKTMGYLQALAGVAITQGKEVLKWETPSQFKVDYPCYYQKKCKTRGTISGYDKYNSACVVNHVAQVDTDFPDMRGFMCGISPNYIHSMDASHMSLVIEKWNGDFGAVHDSFSTHAPDVELLLAHTKQEFITMYDVENFYTRIEDELVDDMDDVSVPRPELGSLNIQEIEDSDYFFA